MIRELWMTKYDQLLALFEEHQQDISVLQRRYYSLKDLVVWYSESQHDSRIVGDKIRSLTVLVRSAFARYFAPSVPILLLERLSCVIF